MRRGIELSTNPTHPDHSHAAVHLALHGCRFLIKYGFGTQQQLNNQKNTPIITSTAVTTPTTPIAVNNLFISDIGITCHRDNTERERRVREQDRKLVHFLPRKSNNILFMIVHSHVVAYCCWHWCFRWQRLNHCYTYTFLSAVSIVGTILLCLASSERHCPRCVRVLHPIMGASDSDLIAYVAARMAHRRTLASTSGMGDFNGGTCVPMCACVCVCVNIMNKKPSSARNSAYAGTY